MTTKNSRQARARAARAAALAPQAQAALTQRLQQMAEEVAQLQTEIAAVEALVLVGEPDPPAGPSVSSSVGWQPSTQPQPWLAARSA